MSSRRRILLFRQQKVASIGGGGTPTILLSGGTVSEDAALSTVVGLLSVANGTGPYSFSIAADPDSKFAIANVNELQIDAALDYEVAQSHSVTIAAADGNPIPNPRTFNISVTNVLEVTLSALSLDADEIEENSAEDTVVGAVVGKTSGSTLSLTGTAGGRFKLSGNNIVAGATNIDYEISTSYEITLRETHADGSNSPRDSVIEITVLNDVSDDPVEPFMDFDGSLGDASRGLIANAATAVALPNNILRLINGVNYANLIGGSGATVTYDQPGYYRSVSSTADGITQQTARLTAGTYTLTVDALSHDETSSYDVFIGTNVGGDTPTPITVGSVEDSFSHTFTVGSTTNVVLRHLWRNTTGDAYDIRFRNVRLHAGASDLGVDTPGGHMLFGNADADSNNPTFSDGTFRQRAIFFPEGGSKEFSEVTIIASFKQDATGSGSQIPFFNTAYNQWSIGSQNSRVVGITAAENLHPIYGRVEDQGWVTVAWRVSATAQELFINSMIVGLDDESYSPVTGTHFFHQYAGGTTNDALFSSGDAMQSLLVYDSFISDSDLTTAIAQLRSRLEGESLTPAAIPYYVQWVGNSLTDDPDSFARRIMTDRPTLIADWTVESGSTLANNAVPSITPRQPYYAMAAADGSIPIVSILHGVNDSKVSSDPEGYYDDLVAVYDMVRNNGGKVMAVTVPPTANSGHNIGRAVVNQMLRDHPEVYDALADLDTTAAAQDDAPGGPYYSDTVHWNSAGYDLITPVIEDALDEIIAQITGGVPAPTADFSVAANSQLLAVLEEF